MKNFNLVRVSRDHERIPLGGRIRQDRLGKGLWARDSFQVQRWGTQLNEVLLVWGRIFSEKNMIREKEFTIISDAQELRVKIFQRYEINLAGE